MKLCFLNSSIHLMTVMFHWSSSDACNVLCHEYTYNGLHWTSGCRSTLLNRKAINNCLAYNK